MSRPRVGVSSCLLGEETRYDGKHQASGTVVNTLARQFHLVSVCPEAESGMGIPREPVHLVDDPAGLRMVGNDTRHDWTDNMNRFMAARLGELTAAGLDGFVLKSRSPSCGLTGAELEDAQGTITRDGTGIFVTELRRTLPNLPLIDEVDLEDPERRRDFTKRVREVHAARAPREKPVSLVKPRNGWWFILLALLTAVLSPWLELLTGSPLPYLLVVLLAMLGIWGGWRLGPAEFGWRWGGRRPHVVALLYPLAVTGLLAGVAAVAGDLSPKVMATGKLFSNLGLMFLSTWLGVLITEEGLYRGALWGLGRRAGWSRLRVLILTSLAFMAWHVAVPLIEKDFLLPGWQIPIYYANVLLLGLTWGWLRLATGSVLVACTAHASWNALVYVFFGYGLNSTALGLGRTWLYDPERGLVGVWVNLLALWLLTRLVSGTSPSSRPA